MDDDLTENAWAQFVIETDEHFINVKQILVAIDGDDIGVGELERLFRSFQSLQWLSNSMGALAMEMLANYVGELLADVCDGVVDLSASMASQLLEAVDDMKMLRTNALIEHSDAASWWRSESQAFHEDLRGQMPEDGAAIDFLPPPAANDGLAILYEDVGLSRFFMRLVQGNMPALTVLMSPECVLPDNCVDCSGCAQMADSIENIAHASEAMGFPLIVAALDEIRGQIPKNGGAVTEAQRERILEKLPQVRALIRLIEAECCADACCP
ncbi:MAG: hypothetical protein WC216_04970 [Gallionella sp.]